MHPKTETDLKKLASNCLHHKGPLAKLMHEPLNDFREHLTGASEWQVFRNEALLQYSELDDGPRDKYERDIAALFVGVANRTKGALLRFASFAQVALNCQCWQLPSDQ
jgi:hypothetical protein